MFSQTARFYDKLYAWKNYAEEAESIRNLLGRLHPGARSVLDIACGTAEHLRFLVNSYAFEGLDLDPELVEIARAKLPEVPIHLGDMADFSLGRQFDALICLFSSIGYLQTRERLTAALRCFEHHLAPGGVVVVEPWLTKEVWKPGRPFMLTVDEPTLKVCRMSHTTTEGDLSILDFDYLVAEEGQPTRHLHERHVLALFTQADFEEAFAAAGLEVDHDPQGLTGRGLYIGRRPA